MIVRFFILGSLKQQKCSNKTFILFSDCSTVFSCTHKEVDKTINESHVNQKYLDFAEDQSELKCREKSSFDNSHQKSHNFIDNKNDLKDYNFNVNFLNYEPMSKTTEYQNSKILQQGTTKNVKDVTSSVPSVSSFIKNSDLVLHPVSSSPSSSAGTSSSSPVFCNSLMEQEFPMEKESILSCSFESDEPYNANSFHNFADYNSTFYQQKQSWLSGPPKNESNSETSWCNPAMHGNQPKFFTQHGTVQVVKKEVVDKPVQNNTRTLHPMKTVQQPKSHFTNVHVKSNNNNNVHFHRMASLGANGSFVNPYQATTTQRHYKASQASHPYYNHMNTHVTIPYRPRYNRRNNPELEKKRVHKCDHPGE